MWGVASAWLASLVLTSLGQWNHPDCQVHSSVVQSGTQADWIDSWFKPSQSEARRATSDRPKLVLIIDDLGDSWRLGQRVANLPVAVNLSIMPNTPFGSKLASLAHRRGHEVMLHFPMEATTRQDLLTAGALRQSHTRNQTQVIFTENLAEIPHVKGFNNHMGSLLTGSAQHMSWVMEYAADRRLYFVDSRTSAESVALEAASNAGIAALGRDIFLDPVNRPDEVNLQLDKALAIAKQKGFAVVIGHPYKETLSVLEQRLPLVSQDFEFLLASHLLTLPDTSLPKASRAP